MADDTDVDFKNRQVWVEGSYSSTPVNLRNARVCEGLSKLTETTIEFLSSNDALDLQDILGSTMTLGLKNGDNEDRYFTGTCISVEYVGVYQGLAHFVAETRPWLWFLTRSYESRIFQEMTVLEILQEVLDGYGLWTDVKKKTSATYKPREYCVQYQESDFDFISRLMEEEGIYYFFIQEDKKLKMVLADSISAHQPNSDGEFDFHFKDDVHFTREDHIFDWTEQTAATTGKVLLKDYNFMTPKAEMKDAANTMKGSFTHNDVEHFRYPSHARIDGLGKEYAKVRMEAEAVKHLLSRGAGNTRTLGVGQTFKMKEHPRKTNNIEYLTTSAVHTMQIETDYEDKDTSNPLFDTRVPMEEGNTDTYRIVFDVIPKTETYRAPQVTKWPAIAGMQTAVVTGPEGEEIHTDKYGRIKIQFFWDRVGKKDENTTCWVRTVMPWTGKNWGMIAIPRIGQEVAIQFEEGDPDRPICTGMLYNEDTMPPYELPANKTMSGIKTRSTKEGGKELYNEFTFEDKKGSEYIRMHAERDYLQVVENNALINIGAGHKDHGDLTQMINRNKTEVVKNVRTHVTGWLEDLTVGGVYDEAVGVSKSETVGVFKEESIGLTGPSTDSLIKFSKDMWSLAVTIGGPISTLAYGGKYADLGAAATMVDGFAKARKPGKRLNVNGLYELNITGDRIETIEKSKSPSPSKEGNVELTLKDGSQKVTVKKGDRTVAVDTGKQTTTIKGDNTLNVDSGGNIINVKSGDHKLTAKGGNIIAKASAGKVTIEAMTAIELKVGGSSIKIDPSGITVKGPMIKNEASGVFKAEGKMTTISGKLTMIDGSAVMIN